VAKPKILFILHAFENRGGTEEHAKTVAEGITDYFTPIFVYPQINEPTGFVILEPDKRSVVECEIPSFPFTPYRHHESERVLKDVISSLNPNIIHIQHWLYWHLGIIEQVASYRIPSLLSLHDFYLFSPEFTLANGSIQNSTSSAYAQKVFGEDCSSYLLERQRGLIQSLQKPDRIITPSPFLEKLISPYRFPQTIEHGIRPFTALHKEQFAKPRIGYAGSFLPQKGSQTLLAVGAEWEKLFPEYPIKIFGAEGTASGLKFEGSFTQDERASVYGEIDLLLIPSVFNETYSLTLSEGWHAQCYPIASRIGALADRITPQKSGHLFEAGNARELLELLISLRDNPPTFSAPPVRLASEMVKDYLDLYSELLMS